MPHKGQARSVSKRTRRSTTSPPPHAGSATIQGYRAWKLEDAKARFSEIVRRARTDGPQRVTLRGKDAVVVIAVEALKKLLPDERPKRSLVAFLQSTALGEIDTSRAPDRGRDLAL